MGTELPFEKTSKKSFPFSFTKLSGSCLSGKNKKEISFSGFNSIIEFSAALKAALYPLSSPSKQTIIL